MQKEHLKVVVLIYKMNEEKQEKQDEIRHKFNAIKQFVHEMASFFQNDMGLKLYDHLLTKTTVTNVAPVQKHITIFTEFCQKNRLQIMTNNSA